MRVGIVTCKVLPEPDPDAKPLDEALRKRNHEPVALHWDDASVSLHGIDVIVIRSPWNYFKAPQSFLRWIAIANQSAPVLNSPSVIKWNIHKEYLNTLTDAGVPTVPTNLVCAGEVDKVSSAIASFGDVVVKPAISAGSFGAKRFGGADQPTAVSHAIGLLEKGDVLVQPYMDSFRSPGERSLVWIDGEWTHAVRKRLRFDGQDESVDASKPPSKAELVIANAALEAVPHKLAYARVDLVESPNGMVLSELELMEPSLFFNHSPRALARFVAMIERVGVV